MSARPNDVAIHADAVSKLFQTKTGDVLALEELNLDVQRGTFVTIVGPSGCGKTTLLRIMAGLETPSAGVIEINGNPVNLGATDLGMVFQDATLLPWLTVMENVLLPLRLASADIKAGRGRAAELLEVMNLSGFERRYPGELSGGMQQRVGIARALINDPEVLLMDEPFGALDAMTRDHLNIELERIWLERGKTVVFITHSIPEAIVLGDRVLVMTPRPGGVADDLQVNLPRPRTPEVLGSAEGLDIERRVRSYFRHQPELDAVQEG